MGLKERTYKQKRLFKKTLRILSRNGNDYHIGNLLDDLETTGIYNERHSIKKAIKSMIRDEDLPLKIESRRVSRTDLDIDEGE